MSHNLLGDHAMLHKPELYRNTNAVMQAARSFLLNQSFNELMPSLLSPYQEPGAKHSVAVMGKNSLPLIEEKNDASGNQVSVTGEHHFFLPVSMVVEKQLALEYSTKVFCFAPCIRLFDEFSIGSKKHLITFTQLEVEIRDANLTQVQATIQELLNAVGNEIETLNLLDIDNTRVASLKTQPFPMLTFQDAIDQVRTNHEHSTQKDLSAEEESSLSQRFETPFFVYKYPAGVRDSIFHENEPGFHETFDLYLPYGYGELSTGGMRAQSVEEIETQSRALGSDRLTAQANYINWKSRTGIKSAGFGIGFERLLHFLHNVDDITEVVSPHIQGPNAMITR